MIDRSRSDKVLVTICTCMYLFNLFYGHFINIPIPYFSFKLPQIKFYNDQYGIGESKDFQRLEKNG